MNLNFLFGGEGGETLKNLLRNLHALQNLGIKNLGPRARNHENVFLGPSARGPRKVAILGLSRFLGRGCDEALFSEQKRAFQ